MLSTFRNFGAGTKIALGYVVGILVLIGAVGTTLWQVRNAAAVTDRVVDLRAPTAQASLMMLNGMNHSLAALRGWIILGKDKFKEERTIAWTEEIEPSVAKMNGFAKNWTDPKNIERLKIIEEKLVGFKKYQKEIEDIANTDDNKPATKLLFEQAAPLASILATNITKMIDIEAEQEATAERKALLGMMADVRGTTGLALANIRAYLLSGSAVFKEKFDRFWAKNTRRFGDLTANAHLLTPDQRVAFDAFSKARKDFDPLPPKMFDIRGSSEWNLANTWLGTKAAPTAFAIKQNLDAMIVSQKQLMDTDMDEAKNLTSNLVTVEWTLLFVGTALCVVLGTLITRSITKPINRVVVNLTEGSDQVTAASGQVATASQELAEGASEQASSLEETSSVLEEMAAMTRTNAENAKQANELTNRAAEAAQEGDKTMGQLNAAMTAINESSGQIGKIIKVIEGIAFQTNLLALNAAVEAARAGEHGKGFAVVADEVRNLAQRAAQAAGETTSLIENSVTKAREGTEVAGSVGKALGAIVQDVTKAASLVNQINQASNEQAEGVNQVNTAISQMDKVTQQNAASAEESAAAAEELSGQAQAVKNIVLELVAVVRGTNDSASVGSMGGRGSATDNVVQKRLRTNVAGIRRAPRAATTAGATKEPKPGTQASDEFLALDDGQLKNF